MEEVKEARGDYLIASTVTITSKSGEGKAIKPKEAIVSKKEKSREEEKENGKVN